MVTVVMWAFRSKGQRRIIFGAVAATACSLMSEFYIVSAVGILPAHLCREEEDQPEWGIGVYLVYPVLLLAVGLLSYLI